MVCNKNTKLNPRFNKLSKKSYALLKRDGIESTHIKYKHSGKSKKTHTSFTIEQFIEKINKI